MLNGGGSLSVAPLMLLRHSELKLIVWMLWCSMIGLFSVRYGNLDNLSAKTISLPGIYCVVIFLKFKEHAL